VRTGRSLGTRSPLAWPIPGPAGLRALPTSAFALVRRVVPSGFEPVSPPSECSRGRLRYLRRCPNLGPDLRIRCFSRSRHFLTSPVVRGTNAGRNGRAALACISIHTRFDSRWRRQREHCKNHTRQASGCASRLVDGGAWRDSPLRAIRTRHRSCGLRRSNRAATSRRLPGWRALSCGCRRSR
jgi:hypothetical protein